LNNRPLTDQAEPAEGFRLYSGARTPPRSAPLAHSAESPSWPTSAPPQSRPVEGPAHLLCPNCLGGVEVDDLYCGGCGVRILWCRSCHGPRVATDRFCSHCGATSDASPAR
jgi:hypothetical protein